LGNKSGLYKSSNGLKADVVSQSEHVRASMPCGTVGLGNTRYGSRRLSSNTADSICVWLKVRLNWLELEAGVTPLFRRHSTEWSTDLLFKKPWTLSPKMEFMLGVGPEWIHTNAYGKKMNSAGIEVAPDFMFWPSRKHKFGWYLEPSYDYKFGPGHEHSLGVTGGLLISIP
jgi:hypothetical protein